MPSNLSWIVVAWSMMAAASLTLALIHLVVWLRQRAAYGHFLFFGLAASASVFAAFELLLMRAPSPQAYADILRYAQIPLACFVLSIVGFVHFYLESGRAWLAYAVCGLRIAALALDFTTGVNVNFDSVTALARVPTWGDAVASPVGVLNPWSAVPQLSNLLLLAFVVDAAVTLWRRGGAVARRRALVVGGSLALCVVLAAGSATLVMAGVVRLPTLVTPSMLVVVVAMGYELVTDVLAAARLATELRAKEAALRENEARMRAVVEAVPSAILLIDDRGTIHLANGQVEATFGFRPDELLGKRVEMLVPRAMHAGRELFGLRKDGSEVPIEVGLNPLPAKDGSLVLVSIVDVTERRRIEREAARQRNELAHLSRVATLGALSGSLAHELNQPLAAILSNAQAAQRFLAMQEPRLDQVSLILADIVKSDRRAASVIQRLRAMLKRDDVRHEPLDVNDAVQDVLRLMHSDLLHRRVDVVLELAPGLPQVAADRVQLQQILVNFVINGCDAMDEVPDARKLTVRTLRDGDGRIEIAVSDTGHGIPPDDLERIFEPFVTTKRHGIGLGLAICRSIVEAHGGRICATNNGNGGATLHLELPVLQHAVAG